MIETYSCPGAAEMTDWRSFGPPRGEAGLDVLLIEDDYDIAEMYRRRLASDGLHVAIAEDAESGLRRLREDRPALLLLDIRLPGEDGYHVLQAVRSEPELAHIPVLMLSNYGEPSTVRRALELGASEYLMKSNTTPGEVALRVRAYLNRGSDLQ
jgi:two-component system, OmpR family, phosphate regulon response regulator PhoB